MRIHLNTHVHVLSGRRSYIRCDQCGYKYRTERHPMADWLQSDAVVHAVTAVALIVLVLFGALVPLPIERALYRTLAWHPTFSPTLARFWAPWADRLVAGLTLPAVGGAALSVLDAYTAHRGLPFEEQRWAGALIVSMAAEGWLLARPLLLGGIFFFGGRLAKRVRLGCRRLLTQFGEQVLDFAL